MSLPATARTPQVSFSIDFGASGSTPGAAPVRILIWGNRIGADITATVATSGGTSESYSFPAGTAPLDHPMQVFSGDDARAKAGPGAECELGVRAAFAQFPTANVWILPVTEAGSDSATMTLTPTVSGLGAGTLRLVVAGRVLDDIAITSSDTVSSIGLKIARAINRALGLPVYAENTWSTGAVAVTYKHPGVRGNLVSIRAELITATQTVSVDGTSLAGTLFGLTFTMSDGAAVGGSYLLAGGVGEDNWSAGITNTAPSKFGRHAAPAYLSGGSASANLARLADALDAAGGTGQQFAQQVVFGCAQTLSATVTLTDALNRARGQVAWLYASDALPIEIAAQVAAARLNGDVDVVTSGAIDGELVAPGANLNGVELATLVPQHRIADQPTPTQVETTLASGISPIVPSPTRSGRCALVASIVSRHLVGGVPNYSLYKTGEVTVVDWVRDAVVEDLRTTFRGFKLVDDRADGKPPLTPKTMTPSTVRARILTLLSKYERAGHITEVAARADALTVTRNGTNRRRLDIVMPVVPTSDLDIITGTEQQLQPGA